MHAWCLADNLQKIGHDVTVLCRQDYVDDERIKIFNETREFQVVRIKNRNPVLRFFEILSHLNRRKFDSLILSGRNEIILGAFVRNRSSIKTSVIVHGYEPLRGNRFLKNWVKRRIRQVQNVICVSRFARENVLQLVQTQCEIIPNGINFNLNSRPERPPKVSGKFYPILLTVGNMTRRKGQHRVIKALPYLAKTYPNLLYNIVGLPTLQTELESLAQSLGVENHIRFTGFIQNHEDLVKEYSEADVFLLLSENQQDGDVEGFGIVALEANYSGLPVIGAKGCGIEDAIDEGKSGFLVDGNNADEILSALHKSLDPEVFSPEDAVKWAIKHHWSNLILDYDRII